MRNSCFALRRMQCGSNERPSRGPDTRGWRLPPGPQGTRLRRRCTRRFRPAGLRQTAILRTGRRRPALTVVVSMIRLRQGLRDARPRHRALIHIGKCGGASVRAALHEAGMADTLRVFHVRRPVYRRNLNYIVVARNPLSRAVSAFNWRYRLTVSERRQPYRFSGEREVLVRYGSLGKLGEALYDDDGNPRGASIRDARRIHHIREDIGYYLTRLLARCRPEQIEAVLMQETLDADIERVFGICNQHRINDNSGMGTGKLSARARANLMRFFSRDYEALARLYAWGKIDREAYLAAVS